MPRWTAGTAIALIFSTSFVAAQERVTEAKASFVFNGERIKIARDNPDAARFALQFAASGGTCGGPCIAPMQIAPGIATLGEIEVLDFLVNEVAVNQGLMVDARKPADRAKGYIPGSVSLPYSTIAPTNSFRSDIMQALGAREFAGVYNFTDARSLLIFDNGPSSDDAGKLVANLLEAGYPAELLRYYRGGMQVWSLLGFSIDEGQS